MLCSTDWFNYNQDELLEELTQSPAKETSFADDLEFAVRGPTKDGCRDGAQKAINTAVRWANRTGLEFSPAKTHVMFLTRRKDKESKTSGSTIFIWTGVEICRHSGLSWSQDRLKTVMECSS